MARTSRSTARRLVAALALALAGAAGAATAHADVAPPPAAPGAALAPEATTQVRMVRERVVLTITSGASSDADAQRASDRMTGAVEADFTLRNEGDAPETMAVRFPLWRDAYEVALPEGFEAEVDGRAVGVDTVDGAGAPIDASAPGARSDQGWAAFDVTFAPRTDTRIVVRYAVEPTGDPPYGTFHYVLDTGAAWAGVIDAAEVVVRLPYAVDAANTALDPASMWDTGPLPSGFVVEGTDVVWRFADLEPTEADNIRLTVLAPTVWSAIVDARAAAAAEPEPTAAAQLALARALAAGVYTSRDVGVVSIADSGALADEAMAAFARALELAPDDPETLVHYALFAGGVDSALLYGDLRAETRDVIERALAAAPDDERLTGVRDAREWFLRASPTWTAEAAAHAAAAADAEAQPTSTGAPLPLVAATAPPDGDAPAGRSLPVTTLGAGLVALLVVAVLALLPFRRRRGR